MKLGIIVGKQFQESFDKLLKSKGVPSSQLFKLKSAAKTVQAQLEIFNDLRKQIIDEVSEKDAQGKMVMHSEGSVKIQADKIDEAQKRLNDLDAIDVILPGIKVSDLGKELELTAIDLLALEFLVE